MTRSLHRFAAFASMAVLAACAGGQQQTPVSGITPQAAFQAPRATAVSAATTTAPVLYVTDRKTNTVTAYDEKGNQIALSGTFSGVLNPSGIAYDPHDQLLYVTNANSTITAYDRNGTRATLSGSFAGVYHPTGIVYDSSNKTLYVTNLGATTGKVTQYDEQGTQLHPLAQNFKNVDGPASITYDTQVKPNGELFVANQTNATVTAYTEAGTQVDGSAWANLKVPVAIEFDSHDAFLYVANTGNNTITAYDSSGFQYPLPSGFPNLNGPVAIAFDPHLALLYVANGANNTITAYHEKGGQATLSGRFANLNDPSGIAIIP